MRAAGTASTTADYRDSSGRTLADYPRPSVAVDTALLTVLRGDDYLSVLQVRRPEPTGWALPGTFLHQRERLIDAVRRSLRDKVGVEGMSPRQLQVFDDPQRDSRGWVLSVAHVAVVRAGQLEHRLTDRTRLAPVDRPGRLPYGHEQIIERAVADVRNQYAVAPDPDRLLAEPFTIFELRKLHEAVEGHALQRDTFRRRMEPQLAGTGRTTSGTRGRPAELFRHPDTVRRHG
jgi:8-oxo-dGTP diphosphatase